MFSLVTAYARYLESSVSEMDAGRAVRLWICSNSIEGGAFEMT